MIGLGVGIDYALFLITRHQDQLRDGMPIRESIANAVATSGSAIVFAGCTVVVALLSLGVAGIPLVSALGLASAIAVVTAVLVGDHPAARRSSDCSATGSAGSRCRRSCGRDARRAAASGRAGPASSPAPGLGRGPLAGRRWSR